MYQYYGFVILYHESNLVYAGLFPQFLIFQKNNIAQTFVIIFFISGYYYLIEKLKIVEKNLCELNCSYGIVSHTLNNLFFFYKLAIISIYKLLIFHNY